MLRGRVRATVTALEHYDVHGQAAVRVLWRADATGVVGEARLAPQSVDDGLAAGDIVEVELLMGEALEIRRVRD